MTDFAAAAAAYTGQSIAALFFAQPPLVAFVQDAEGVVTISHWDASLGAQPTIAALEAALAAPPTKAALIAYAAAKRWEIETGGIVQAAARIDTSRESQSLIANAHAYVQASGAASVAYKAASGWVTLDAATITAVALAVGAHVQACFALENQIDTQIAAGTITTTAQIDDPTTVALAAWPPNS